MHHFDETTAELAARILAYALDRVREDPPLDGPMTQAELRDAVGSTVVRHGLGADEAFARWEQILAPATISSDHPRFLGFVPAAPTNAAVLFDLVVGASSIYAGSWMEGAGAVEAENQALAWVAGLAGLPAGAGGCFVQGGTIGNLSALVAARHWARGRRPESAQRRALIAATAEAHSSIRSAAAVMDAGIIAVEPDAAGRMRAGALVDALDAHAAAGGEAGDVVAVVATAGTTNLGRIDELDAIASVCAERELWLHVDGAYGGAALAAPSVRARFAGIERADSFIVDPHKWLFAPFDACALLYRDPELARQAHAQHAAYLDSIHVRAEWNPSDYAVHLSRRARGLPFWFSLAVHGTDAYAEAIEGTLAVARLAADEIRRRPELELVVEPELSVLVFRRHGWSASDYEAWSARLLHEGYAFVPPTTVGGETVARMCLVNPTTTFADIVGILDSMTEAGAGGQPG